jgi:hypothetical protein
MADNSRCPLQVFKEKLSFASHPKSFLWSLLFGSKTKNFSLKSFSLPSGLQFTAPQQKQFFQNKKNRYLRKKYHNTY